MKYLLQLTVLFVVVINLLSTFLVLYETDQSMRVTTAQAITNKTGTVRFCVNQQPLLTVPCSPNMTQDTLYVCQLNVTHPEGPVFYFQIPQPPDNESLFNISDTGLINFTPTNEQRGNHSTNIGVDDNSHCDNAYDYELFSFTVLNVNDPPYLIRAIPHQTMNVNTTLYAFYLNDYFADIDEDILTYTLIREAAEMSVNVTIMPDSAVVFTSSQCGKAHFKFRATDPYDLSAESNAVQLEVTCPSDASGSTQQGETGSGGGGGGGGASLPCEPELVCMPWSECYPNGMQVQVCKDKNGCSDSEIKFYENCTYVGEQILCEENWLCSDWGICSAEGRQNRTCTDLMNCQTTRFRPPLEQDCVYAPRCDDGIQNGDETGVDCGGSCPSCRTIQQPTVLSKASRFSTMMMLLLIVVLAILLALFTLYRERIYEGLVELGWLMARRRQKEILLTAVEKRVLFEGLLRLDKERADLAPDKAYEALTGLLRQYFSFILDVPFEFTDEDVKGAMAVLKASQEPQALLNGLFGRLELLESGVLPSAFKETLFISIEEELRLMVCMTSSYSVSEIERPLPERNITPELAFSEEIHLRLLNALEALQFQRVDAAEQEYLAILRAYENLPDQARALVYLDIHRLYLAIRYVAETSE